MGFIVEAFGGFHWKTYSAVDIKTGKPLQECKANGAPLKKQQSVLLARRDEKFTSVKCWQVQELAIAKAKEIEGWEKALSTDEVRPDGDLTVSQFFETVFLPYIESEKEPSTVQSYKSYWGAYLSPHFNHTKTLKGYEPFVGTNLLEKLASEYSDNTVSHARALASAIFNYACAKGYIKTNPWRDVKKTISGKDVEDGYAYNQQEIEACIDALNRVTGREEYSAEVAAIALSVGFYAGLRPSEIAGLRWENVFTDRIIVNQAFVVGKSKGTKTGKIRTVIMLPQLRNRMKAWRMKWNNPTSGWVFPSERGDNPMHINRIAWRVIKPTLDGAKIKWEGFYAARRGFGTLMVLAGATLDEVADAMGNSPDVVFKHYFKDRTSSLAAKGIAKVAAAMGAL